MTATATTLPALSKADANTCEVLNSLLRGELSAVETYDQAIAKFESAETVTTLTGMRDQHHNSVNKLRSHIIGHGGEPATSSGVWGSFAKLVTGTAKILGPSTVISALREGEEHGVNVYETALENLDVSPECRFLIRGDLLPLCREHLRMLAKLDSSAAE